MHEHGITNAVVHQILHACEDNHIKNPKRITIQLGALTSYKKESLKFYFEKAKQDFPILKNAVLDIFDIPGRVSCNSCGKESDASLDESGNLTISSVPLILCPNCKSADIKIIQGNDVIIRKIDD